ncbi:VOC family protein [Vulgatibacter incomptus]|uniref:Putative lyase n=1 Tax=Vulgatibacter incomptus TaxID=1391653 RepID=A0A0K1PCE3_9BACT|nr:VOC family protein [Vulgatibacter incomptus]AKU91190.1 putative lyase [Vulgatibacter incomptus]
MKETPPDYFWPETGMVLAHLLIVRDVDRSREFYSNVLGAQVQRDRNPCVMRFHNSYIVVNEEGGPTDDKPKVDARAPADSKTLSSALLVRVTDVHATYSTWKTRGARFLTEPKDHELEIRCYLQDPDGYLIELGQATGILDEMGMGAQAP